MSQRRTTIIGWIVSLGGLMLLWWLLTVWQDSFLFPSPVKVFKEFFSQPTFLTKPYFKTTPWFFGDGFFADVVPSMTRMFLGYGLAVILGVGFGVLLGLVPILEYLSEWIINFSRAIPPPALLGVWVVIFGVGSAPKVYLIAFAIVWPILLNTIDGIQSVDEQRIQAAKVFRIPFWRQITTLYIPSASPKILSGMRITIGFALVMMLISEYAGATNGMGLRLKTDLEQSNYLDMWATMVLLALIGLVLNTAFVFVEKRLMRWNANAGGIEI